MVQAVGLVALVARQAAVKVRGLPVGGHSLFVVPRRAEGDADVVQAAGLLLLAVRQAAIEIQGPPVGGHCFLVTSLGSKAVGRGERVVRRAPWLFVLLTRHRRLPTVVTC